MRSLSTAKQALWKSRDHHSGRASPRQTLSFAPKDIHAAIHFHLAESQPDPVDGPPRCSIPLPGQLWRCLVDGPESAAADGDVFLRLRNRTAVADSGRIRAEQGSRSISSRECCRGSLSRKRLAVRPGGILENRVLVKKVVFPLEILPVTHVISGLVTQAFAAAIFIFALAGVSRLRACDHRVAAGAADPAVVIYSWTWPGFCRRRASTFATSAR